MSDLVSNSQLGALTSALVSQLGTMASTIQNQVLTQSLPLVGTSLASGSAASQAWQAVQNLDTDVQSALNNLITKANGDAILAAGLAAVLNQAIAQAGFSQNAVVNVSPGGAVTVTFNDSFQQSYAQALDANLGLPNIPLSTSGTANATVGFTLNAVATVDLAGNVTFSAPTGALLDASVQVNAPSFATKANLG